MLDCMLLEFVSETQSTQFFIRSIYGQEGKLQITYFLHKKKKILYVQKDDDSKLTGLPSLCGIKVYRTF